MALCPNPNWFVMVVCGLQWCASSWAFLCNTVKYTEKFFKEIMEEEYRGIKGKPAVDPFGIEE